MAYFKFSFKQLVATAIGASIFFLLTRFLSFPIFGDIFLNLQYAVVAFFAVIFGPVSGLLVGLTGHFFAELSLGDGILWSSVIATASVGLLTGFLFIPGKVEAGEFDGMDAVRFVVGCLVVGIISWGVVKPVCDILFYSYRGRIIFTQGLIMGAGNFVITAIFGSFFILGYSRTRKRQIDPD